MKIKEAIKDKITGEWGDADDVGLGVQVLRTTNFTNAGRISYKKVVKRKIPNSLIEKKKLLPGDIIIEKSGGSPKQPVGRVVFFDNNNDLFLCNNFTAILRPSERLVPKYFFYDLFYKYLSQVTLKYQNKTTGIINLQLDRYLDEKINVPSFVKQQQIVQILDTADTFRQKRKEQLNLFDDYLKSVFFEMFGDPIINEKGWGQMFLREVSSDMKYGTNVKCSDRSQQSTVPVLRIPNIFKGDIDLSDLKYGKIESKEFEKLLLKKGDLLFVRTNGNPDYIGRCAVFTLDGEYINASYLIRVRLKAQSKLTSFFIYYVVTLPSYRSKIARESRTTAGNYNINTQGLKSLKIIQPPVSLQNKFASIAEHIEQTKQKMRASLDEMDNHFNALMQRCFG